MKRRRFLQATLASAPLASPLIGVPALPLNRNPTGFKVDAGEGRRHGHIQLMGPTPNVLDLKVSGQDTDGGIAFFEQTSKSYRRGTPLHVHYFQDEIFYVLEGEYLFQVGEVRHTLRAGDTIFLPRRVPHAWAQLQETGKMLVILQPAGKMEEFFLSAAALPKDATREERDRNAEKHDMKMVSPPIQLE